MCGENDVEEGAHDIVSATAAMVGQEGKRKSVDTQERVRLLDLQRDIGTELGVVRLSLGVVTDFRDVWDVLKFATTFAEP